MLRKVIAVILIFFNAMSIAFAFRIYVKPSLSYQYGISLLPGVSFDNTVIGHLRLGVLRSNFPNASAQVSANQIGVGLEYSLSQNWGVNGEYNSERYKGSTAVGTATTGKYTIGVLYKFNL